MYNEKPLWGFEHESDKTKLVVFLSSPWLSYGTDCSKASTKKGDYTRMLHDFKGQAKAAKYRGEQRDARETNLGPTVGTQPTISAVGKAPGFCMVTPLTERGLAAGGTSPCRKKIKSSQDKSAVPSRHPNGDTM